MSHWVRWLCEFCGRMNHSRTASLPAASRIDAKCTACGARSTGVEWTEGRAPEMTARAEKSGRWACPHCGAHNEVDSRVEGAGRLTCKVCGDPTKVILFGGLDAPTGEI